MNYSAQNIRYLRVQKNLSQSQLALILKLSRNQINSYENENSQPSIETLQKIAEYFQISLDNLVQLKIDKHNRLENGLISGQ